MDYTEYNNGISPQGGSKMLRMNVDTHTAYFDV